MDSRKPVVCLGSVTPPAMPSLEFPVLGEREHAMLILRPRDDRNPVATPWAQPTIDGLMAEHFPGCVQGMTLVSLVVPGQTIPEHTDDLEDCTERVHVPLITDPDCYFVTGGEEHHMACGSAWLIDPTNPHSVTHRGRRNRIHLMFNVRRD